jgi:multiple sugar transport system ATP-binding protein
MPVEPMGAGTLIWSTINGRPFRFRMDGLAAVATGDLLSIGFEPARASIFDQAQELRI